MATQSSMTEVSLPLSTRESSMNATTAPTLHSGSFSSNRLFSKIARSPTSSRRHRALPSEVSGSGPGSGTDNVPDSLISPTNTSIPSLPPPTTVSQTQGAQHSKKNHVRPGFSRQISAPDTPVLRPTKEEAATEYSQNHHQQQRHYSHSDATHNSSHQARAAPSLPQVNAPSAGPSTSKMFPLVSEYYQPHQMPNSAAGNAINFLYQQFTETAHKRIATLQYMRRAYEGKLFWLNTAQVTKRDFDKFLSHSPNRLARRATNFFLLGISIPAVLDIHHLPPPGSSSRTCSTIAMEFLSSLNRLMAEFESYQEKHPTDGTNPGSLSRARLPSMFKRSGTTSRPRKSSSAPSLEIGSQISPPAVPDTPHHQHQSNPSVDTTASAAILSASSTNTVVSPATNLLVQNFSATATFPQPGSTDAPNSSLLPHEALYSYLLTPPLPFTPDFYSVFATLCDVLIDTYQRLLHIINEPNACNATVTEIFTKTDARIRKVMVGGIVRDFENASRENAKRELAGVQKVVLGGLMG